MPQTEIALSSQPGWRSWLRRFLITGNTGKKWPRVLAAVLNAAGACIAAVVSAQPCHPTYHTRMRALCVTVKKPSIHHVQDRKEASCGSRERRELTEENRPTSLRPDGVVAPEVAGLLSKARPRPSTAPLPSFPSPNPPHFLTVIGLLCAGEQFVSTTAFFFEVVWLVRAALGRGVQGLADGARERQPTLQQKRRQVVALLLVVVLHVVPSSSLLRSHSSPCSWICMLL